jgi:hypothetical protein
LNATTTAPPTSNSRNITIGKIRYHIQELELLSSSTITTDMLAEAVDDAEELFVLLGLGVGELVRVHDEESLILGEGVADSE